MIATHAKEIEWFLDHAVENVYPSKDALRERLRSGARLRVYLGIDPTGPSLHVGHFIALKKLSELQRLGHEVILLIGDFTAMIGDPTDKLAVRKQQTREQVLENCRLYREQAALVLDFEGSNPARFEFNAAWLARMSFAEVIELAAHFTVQQMLERDMFEKRLAEEKPVYLHEFFYPLMQGYDSVALDVDLEVGGNDQTFNMLAGRTLMREMKHKDKAVMVCRLLSDPSGKKMGKSEGNMIAVTDAPEDMYGKVMRWTDGMIVPGYQICTDLPDEKIRQIEQAIKAGDNPMTHKHDLAFRIVEWLAGHAQAVQGREHFQQVHQSGELPDTMAELLIDADSIALVDALVQSRLAASKTDARRQLEQGAVKVNGAMVKDAAGNVIILNEGVVLQKGKRGFVRLKRG